MSMGRLIIGSFVASNVFHLDNPKNIIFSYININSIRNKFGNLCWKQCGSSLSCRDKT